MLAAAVASVVLCFWKGFRNATCGALALAYFAAEGWYWIDGPRTVGDLFMLDVVTILLITCKTIARHPRIEPFRDGIDHLAAFLAAPTFADRLILGLFILAVWPAYFMEPGTARWFMLWGATIAQFIIAGGESLHNYALHRREAKSLSKEPEEPPGPYRIAWAGVETWQT